MRKNGFSRPLNRFQVALWIFTVIQILLNEISLMPVLPEPLLVRKNLGNLFSILSHIISFAHRIWVYGYSN